MSKLAFGPKCPYCRDIAKKRITRSFWMRLLPLTKYYQCNWCGCRFFSILNAIAFRLL